MTEEYEDACGPESIQWILAQDGRHAGMKTLVKECSVKQDSGTYTSTMVSVLAKRGYKPWIEQDVSWARVKDLLPTHHILIAWWTIFFPNGETQDGGGSHWSVIDHLTEKRVGLYDPDYEKVVEYPLQVIDAHWVTPEDIDDVLHDECRLAIFLARRPVKKRKAKAKKKEKK